MTRIGKSYVSTTLLRRGTSAEIDNALVTLADQITTEDFTVTSNELNSFNAYRQVTSDYTIVTSDSLIEAVGTFTVTLPTALAVAGKSYTIKNGGMGSVTLDGNLLETIDGEQSVVLCAYECVVVTSNGLNWLIV